MIAKLKADSFESNVESGAAWVGTPAHLREQIQRYRDEIGEFESASLQVNFNTISYADAKLSMDLFAREVMPHFAIARRRPAVTRCRAGS